MGRASDAPDMLRQDTEHGSGKRWWLFAWSDGIEFPVKRRNGPSSGGVWVRLDHADEVHENSC